jgi:RNA polymerase sigma factor (sigma-70 family)
MNSNIDSDNTNQDLAMILKRANAGDPAAWEVLFRECYPKVRRVVRRKLNRSMRSLYDSTDFAADVMKSLAANIGQIEFPSIESLLAYLAQVAEQKVIDEYRRRHTQKRDVAREQRVLMGKKDNDSKQVSSSDPSASQLAEAKEIQERLLANVDETEKTIIQLKQQDYSNAEIAERTGWNIRRVQRFFKDLKDKLVDEEQDMEQWTPGESSKEQLPVSRPTHPLSVFFDDAGFTDQDIELFLSYLSETYRDLGGVGLKVVGHKLLIPDSEPVEAL